MRKIDAQLMELAAETVAGILSELDEPDNEIVTLTFEVSGEHGGINVHAVIDGESNEAVDYPYSIDRVIQ